MPKPLNQIEFEALQDATKSERQSLRSSQTKIQEERAILAQVNNALQEELAKGRNANAATVSSLEADRNAAQANIDDFQQSITDSEANINANIDEILFELDPRALVGLLEDRVPIFMMPLRIETRFMTVKHIARIAPAQMVELPRPTLQMQGGTLIRVPERVSVEQAFAYYTEMPNIEDSHELWVRIFPDDIAIHTHEKALTEIEYSAGKTFWDHIWHAGPDDGLRIGAWRGLVSGRGPERAAWVANSTRPNNHASRPTVTIPPEDPLPVSPDYPTPPLKDGSWSEMPHSRVMPDRVVVRAYQGETYRELVGKPIPDPLPLSLDPTDETNTIDTAGGDLTLPEKLRWMQDFEEAEKIGMGIRIPLSALERSIGFTKIIVGGVKTSANKEEGKELIEDLIENHHYTKTGFSIVPQGTPTNNTDDAVTGHTEDTSDDERLFEIETGPNLFEGTTDVSEMTDGQYLADALGIEYDAVQHIRDANIMDIKEAMCMNTALWPTTLGYYLRHLLHPMFSTSEIARVKSHFNSNVLGRGKIPAIRVGSQPYGILATTAFSKLEYTTTSGQEGLLAKMHANLLTPMSEVWDGLLGQVARASGIVNPNQKNKQFLEIIGLHPSSVEFYQRFASGSYFLWNLYNYSKFIQGASSPAIVSYANSLQFATAFTNVGLTSLHAPRVFDLTYISEHKYLNGPVIDPLKFSELRGIKPMGSNDENYIDWLIASNWEQIRSEDFSNIGAPDASPPTALLYLMLRHSCLLEYVRTSLTLLSNNNIVSANALLDHELVNYNLQTTLTPEVQNLLRADVFVQEATNYEADLDAQVTSEFNNLASQGALNGITLGEFETRKSVYKNDLRASTEQNFLNQVSSSFDNQLAQLQIPSTKVGLLTENYSFMTSGDTLHEFVHDKIWGSPFDQDVAEMQELIRAMTCLKGLPTARLERCFAEHVDLASYRLDAWFTSLASERLAKHRAVQSNRRKGLYIGAYGWLENVQPDPDFPGIHYQEVDVQPNVIVVPGFSYVDTGPINNNIPVVGQDIWGEIDQRALGQLEPPTSNPQGIEGIVYGRQVPFAPVYETYPFLEKPDAEFTGLSYASAKSAVVDRVMSEIEVDQPWPILNSEALFDSPMCSYLGSSGMGDIMLDPIKNKFVHVPRTNEDNQGYIHAPSINQATAAAVLRAGYASHRANTGSSDNAMAVNLSSARVRRAMFYLEGMKHGQELGALLGYQLERGLHDHELLLDAYILEFRLKFPLVAGRVTTTGTVTSIDQAESYNVVNGLALVEASAAGPYPYGVSGLPTSGTSKTAIIKEVDQLSDDLDAINDLLMAESMYQVVQGNHPRAGSALNAMSGKGIPAHPQVIDTPRSFHVLTHRTGIQFDLTSGGHSLWTSNGSPRSLADPGLNRWLSTVLPPAAKIKFNYSYQFIAFDGEVGSTYSGTATVDDLEIEPIDLYHLLSQPAEQGDAIELVQRIAWHIHMNVLAAPNAHIEIAFEDRTGFDPTDITLKELHPLIVQLGTIVGDSRPINARDHLLGGNSDQIISDNPTLGVDTTGLNTRLNDTKGVTMSNGQSGLAGVIADLTAEIDDTEVLLGIGNISFSSLSDLTSLTTALMGAANFGVSNSVPVVNGTSLTEVAEGMVAQAKRALDLLTIRNGKAADEFTAAAAAANEDLKAAALTKAAKEMYGRSFNVFPEYKVYNPAEVDAATQYTKYLDDAGPEAVEEWLQGISPVRKRVHSWHQAGMLSEALIGQAGQLKLSVAQLPLLPLDGGGIPDVRWLGVGFPANYEIPEEVISLVFQLPTAYSSTGLQAGILIDEWTEEIPKEMAHTGIAVHYNNPDSEPAQTCLLAVSPNEGGKWSWDDVMETINETFAWAKKRAIDPDILNTTLFAQVLPATFAAVSGADDSPTLDYGRNIIQNPLAGVVDMIKIKEYNA